MAIYKIEENIPLPISVRASKKYPFNEMKVQDSFLVEIEKGTKVLAKKQNVYTAMWRYTTVNPDKKFITSSEEKGIRIWRIK